MTSKSELPTYIFTCKICEAKYFNLREFIQHKKNSHREFFLLKAPTVTEEVTKTMEVVSSRKVGNSGSNDDIQDKSSVPSDNSRLIVGIHKELTKMGLDSTSRINDSENLSQKSAPLSLLSVSDNNLELDTQPVQMLGPYSPISEDDMDTYAVDEGRDKDAVTMETRAEESRADDDDTDFRGSDDPDGVSQMSSTNPKIAPIKLRKIQTQRQCFICGKKFSTKGKLRSHKVKRHIEFNLFQCTECPYTTTIPSSYDRHKSYHNRQEKFQCSLCSATYPLKFGRDQHERDVHQLNIPKGQPRGQRRVTKRKQVKFAKHATPQRRNPSVHGEATNSTCTSIGVQTSSFFNNFDICCDSQVPTGCSTCPVFFENLRRFLESISQTSTTRQALQPKKLEVEKVSLYRDDHEWITSNSDHKSYDTTKKFTCDVCGHQFSKTRKIKKHFGIDCRPEAKQLALFLEKSSISKNIIEQAPVGTLSVERTAEIKLFYPLI